MKTFEITIYDNRVGKIVDIYEKEFFNADEAKSYCRGRTSATHNAMFEERKNRKGVTRATPRKTVSL